MKISHFWDKGGTINPPITYPPLAVIIAPQRDRKYSDSGYKERSYTQNDARKQEQNISKQVKSLIV